MPSNPAEAKEDSATDVILRQQLQTNPKIYTLIVAAGKGSRFGAPLPKQYLTIAGSTVLEHSVNALSASRHINEVYLVIAKEDKRAQSLHFNVPVHFCQGGIERWHSVQQGVKAVLKAGAKPDDLLVIHDAARPCISPQYVDAVIDVAKTEVYGAILGVPVADTLKQIEYETLAELDAKDSDKEDKSNYPIITKTVDRSGLWQAQTPQVFRIGKLSDVLDKVADQSLNITDEASAFEAMGYPIRMVKGSHQNLKLTYQEDMAFIERLLAP